MNSPIQAVIFDWAGTIVDFGSFAPTSIFVEAFKQGFDFEISLAEARERWDWANGSTLKPSENSNRCAALAEAIWTPDASQRY